MQSTLFHGKNRENSLCEVITHLVFHPGQLTASTRPFQFAWSDSRVRYNVAMIFVILTIYQEQITQITTPETLESKSGG